MADGEVFTAATGQGLVVSTGILGDLVLPEGAFDPDRADEIRALAAQAAVYPHAGQQRVAVSSVSHRKGDGRIDSRLISPSYPECDGILNSR